MRTEMKGASIIIILFSWGKEFQNVGADRRVKAWHVEIEG